ncbi:hypothetical protein GALMADRAFT_141492 [Galerina marginata CBS 339.88]|uniref:HNH nuclease domain-containing protein n=1 Tax=Galerina marginata (strain CBS 339.88) TaxID=685588 RepID=A0A067SUC5_GALM3|nr:hypothetical protein GALMADRAFT_141492 [Galerina marginata CBS 339.88]
MPSPLHTKFSLLVRSNKGRTPTPRSHPSAPSFDIQKQAFSGFLEKTPSKHDALHRDGYRCILSGKLDFTSVNAKLVVPKPGEKETVTEASHIFYRSTNEDLDDAERPMQPQLKQFCFDLAGSGPLKNSLGRTYIVWRTFSLQMLFSIDILTVWQFGLKN